MSSLVFLKRPPDIITTLKKGRSKFVFIVWGITVYCNAHIVYLEIIKMVIQSGDVYLCHLTSRVNRFNKSSTIVLLITFHQIVEIMIFHNESVATYTNLPLVHILYVGQVTEMRLSCYLVLLSTDNKSR